MVNHYDDEDYVRREYLMAAEGLKFAAYRVRTPGGDKFTPYQFHMTYMDCARGENGFSMVNERSVVICAMLGQDLAVHLAGVVERFTPETQPLTAPTYFPDSASGGLVIAYQRKDHIEFQIRQGDSVLGLMGYQMAKLFCTSVRRCIDGPSEEHPSRTASPEQHAS